MEDKSNISIFQGSAVEADTVHDFLAQHDIGSLVRNHMQENLDAGWLTAEADQAAEVFVAREDRAKAEDLLRNLYHEEESKTAQTAAEQPLKTPAARQAATKPEQEKRTVENSAAPDRQQKP